MYMKRMLEVGVAANGYVVECRAQLKPKKKGDKKHDELSCYAGSAEKQYIAKDEEELGKLLKALVPLLDRDKEFTSEDEFDAAFKDAVGS